MISINPKIKNGTPHIKGTRVTVSEVISALADGVTISQLVDRCKKAGVKINTKKIKEALFYAVDNMGINYEYKE